MIIAPPRLHREERQGSIRAPHRLRTLSHNLTYHLATLDTALKPAESVGGNWRAMGAGSPRGDAQIAHDRLTAATSCILSVFLPYTGGPGWTNSSQLGAREVDALNTCDGIMLGASEDESLGACVAA